MPEQPEISILVPAFNEAQHIEEAIERAFALLSRVVSTFEIIVVDDGSKDGTFGKLQSLSSRYQCLKVIRNGSNMGKGFSVKHAAEHVTGNSVIVIDADLDIDPQQLKNYVNALKEYDMCIASKRHRNSVYHAPIMRKFLSLSFNGLVRILTGVKFADSQTGLKAVRGTHFRRIMNVISVKRYAYDVEILAVAQLMRLKVAEMPVRIEQSSRFSVDAVFYMLIDLLGVAYRLRIIKWYQKNLHHPNPKYSPLIRI